MTISNLYCQINIFWFSDNYHSTNELLEPVVEPGNEESYENDSVAGDQSSNDEQDFQNVAENNNQVRRRGGRRGRARGGQRGQRGERRNVRRGTWNNLNHQASKRLCKKWK